MIPTPLSARTPVAHAARRRVRGLAVRLAVASSVIVITTCVALAYILVRSYLADVDVLAARIAALPLPALRQKIVLMTAVFAALVICFGVVGSVVFATVATRPLRTLVQGADAIARGEAARVDLRTGDEVEELATSFNMMVDNVAQVRAQFAEHRRTLEEQVGARTARLETLNRELQEANHLKSEFLATVSHELRTPLNVILGYCEMLADDPAGTLSDEQRQLIAAVQRYSKLQLDLITNVLDFSRLTSGKVSLHLERFELAPLLVDVQNLYKQRLTQSSVELRLLVDADVPELHTDRIKLQEVIRNLVENALKFTQRGRVTVAAHRSLTPDWITIEITDTGPGIAPEELPHIFEAFHQAGEVNTRGTSGVGLGLSIAKQLVEALCGTIGVSSQVGTGSSFRLEIPCRLSVADATEDLSPSAQGVTL